MLTYWETAEIIGYNVSVWHGGSCVANYFVDDLQDDPYQIWRPGQITTALDEINRYGDTVVPGEDGEMIKYVAKVRY